jgi:hypothetical protein
MTGSVVPAFIARAAAAKDPYVREATNPLEAIQARIPRLSESLPYKPVATIATQGGVPITKPKMREGGALVQYLSPVQISKEAEDRDIYEALLARHKAEKGMNKALREGRKETLRDIRRTN